MSAMMIDTRTFEYDAEPAVTTQAHPRGRGFQVLSRIARVQADDAPHAADTGYAPRHRLDELPDRALQALAV